MSIILSVKHAAIVLMFLAVVIFSDAQTSMAQTLDVGSAPGIPGGVSILKVSFLPEGREISGIQSDMHFHPAARVQATASGQPNCTAAYGLVGALNEDFEGIIRFLFLPIGCSGTQCSGVRMMVVSTDTEQPIDTPGELFRCSVSVASSAPSGSYVVVVSNVAMSDETGGRVIGFGSDGAINVSQPSGGGCS